MAEIEAVPDGQSSLAIVDPEEMWRRTIVVVEVEAEVGKETVDYLKQPIVSILQGSNLVVIDLAVVDLEHASLPQIFARLQIAVEMAESALMLGRHDLPLPGLGLRKENRNVVARTDCCKHSVTEMS